MPIDKIVRTVADAIGDVADGSTVLMSGFGHAGVPNFLIEGLIEQGAKDLTVVSNNAGIGRIGLGALMATGRVAKIVCTYPRTSGSVVFDQLYAEGKIEVELVPQGTMSERMRAAGAGLGGFYTPVSVDTKLAEGKEVREINGRRYVFEYPLKGDLALVQAQQADRFGNLVYRKSARNFGPVMAMAGTVTVAQVREIVGLGDLDPETIVTPSIFVDRVIQHDDLADVQAA